MKGLSTLITFQALISTISGILMAEMSFVGRASISLFYRDYSILKYWWKTALILFAVQLLLIFVLWLSKTLSPRILHIMICLILLGGGAYLAYLMYMDFTTTAHRLLKFDFHLGGYLIWVGWGLSCLYFLFIKKKRTFSSLNRLNNDITTGSDPTEA